MDMTTAIAVAAFVGILALLAYVRTRSSKFEIKLTDIVVAVLPIVIFLLVTGKIQKFEFGEFKIETAFVNATKSAIASQVSPLAGLPSEPIRIDPKRGVSDIPRLIKRKTEGLNFRIGQGGYYGPAIAKYLKTLTRFPFLRYIVLENENGTFFGIADARELAAFLEVAGGPRRAEDFARWLNAGDRANLAKLPGFIGAENAVSKTTDKREALQRMESLDVDTLPVVKEDKRLAGIVDRSRLTASLIIDMAQQLKGE